MWRYAAIRLLLAVPTFLGITIVTFAVINLAPGEPGIDASSVMASRGVSVQTHEQLRSCYRLDEPLVVRYVDWLYRVIALDFGRSFQDGRLVLAKITERIIPTLLITVGSIIVSLIIAVPTGACLATRAGGWLDRLTSIACFAGYSVPRYVMAVLVISLIGVQFDLLPFIGVTSDNYVQMSFFGKIGDVARHSVLLMFCFSYPITAYMIRFVRDSMVDVLGEDYVRTARAKGLAASVILYRHALPNVVIPLLTLIGTMLPMVLGGAVILEVMFSWPGLGRLLYESVMSRDYPVVMGISVLSAALVLVGTLAIDLAYAAVDPRVRCV